jgi:class 3 adenylate cyclase
MAADRGSISEPIDGERKTVTALFADIEGSRELIHDLDPEEARAIRAIAHSSIIILRPEFGEPFDSAHAKGQTHERAVGE